MNTKKKTIAVLMAAIMVSAVVWTIVPMAMANQPPTDEVDTAAEIAGGSIPPVIKYKWELPDDDPITPRCQIIPPSGTWDPATAVETEGVNPLVVWTAVRDEEGISDIMTVQNEVFHPDGSMKWQEVMIEVTDRATIQAAVDAAVASGQIAAPEGADIMSEFDKNECRVFCYEGEINTHQPAGMYTARVYATDFGGQTSVKLDNTFEVISILAFAIDFDLVDWGAIKPLTKDTVSGSPEMDAMPGLPGTAGTHNNPPTIKNLGNDPLSLKLHFAPLVGVNQGKVINTFDATFMGVEIDPIFASTSVDWVNDVDPAVSPVKLERCQTAQIDFSIHPPDTVTTDTYTGKLHITVIDP